MLLLLLFVDCQKRAVVIEVASVINFGSVGSGRCWFVYELIHPLTIYTLVTGMAGVASLGGDCI